MSLQSQANTSEVMLIDHVVISLPLMFSPEANWAWNAVTYFVKSFLIALKSPEQTPWRVALIAWTEGCIYMSTTWSRSWTEISGIPLAQILDNNSDYL